jgi:hypothetical protein
MTDEAPAVVWPPGCVLVHHHLFKNAGTTIDWILRRAFGERFLDHEAAVAAGLMSAEALLAYVLDHPSIQAISRHHLPFATMSHPGCVFLDILLVRHPIARLRSIYDFLRAEPVAQDDIGALAQELDLGGFLHALLDRFPSYVNNQQVTLIANAGNYLRPPDEDDARRAIDVVRRATITGAVEQFDDAFIAAEYFLQALYGQRDLAYVAQNTATDRQPLLAQRLAECRRACGDSLYRHLVRVNELDFELVRAAEAEMARRIRLVPRYTERRADYLQRCQHLRAIESALGTDLAPIPSHQSPGARGWEHPWSHVTDKAVNFFQSMRSHRH